MRAQHLASAIILVLILGCGHRSGEPAKQSAATLSSKLSSKVERYLDSQLPQKSAADEFVEDEEGGRIPNISRLSDDWQITIPNPMKGKPWGSNVDSSLHVQGQVITRASGDPAVGKFVRIWMTDNSLKDSNNWRYGNIILSSSEAEKFIRSIDRGLLAMNQITLGSSDSVYFEDNLNPSVSINGSFPRKDVFTGNPGEFTLLLRIDKCSQGLRSNDWIDLKQKIAAARAWCDSQPGDQAFFQQELSKTK